MSLLDDLIRDAGSAGMVRRAVASKPDAEDVIRGYFDTDDANYGLRMLISQFERQKQAQPFTAGDRVRVRRRFWYLGHSNNGWDGYSQMFADATGTVTEVGWNPHLEWWYLMVQYEHPYRYSNYLGDFYVKDHAVSFMFHLDQVKKVHR